MGKWCVHASSFIFDQIVIKVAGNQDRHKSSDEFYFGPLVSMAHLYVFWNEIWPWHIGLRWAIVALWATCLIFLSNFLSHLSQELWGIEGWNLVHTWTMGECIVYTGMRLLRLICPFSFMPQLRRSWRGILVSGCACVCPCLHPSDQEPCMLGFWNFIYGFLMEKYLTYIFFLVRVISLSGVMPLWKNLNEIWCMPYLMNRAC